MAKVRLNSDEESAQKIKIHSLAASINAFLDPDVRVLSAWIADPDFEGYCHCKLYYKEKD